VRYAVREALQAFRRAPLLSALGVATIAFSLFSLGLFGIVALNIRDALARVEERVEVRAFLADSATAQQVTGVVGAAQRYPEVARVDVVTSAEALRRARRELGEFRDVFDAAVLPASVELRLRPGHRDAADVQAVASRMRALPGVDDVRYGEEWVRKLAAIRAVASAAGVALGAAFAVAALIITGATIRIAVLARSREIQLMRLVGATDGFVRLPFLLEGAAGGLLGGALALLLTYGACAVVRRYVVDVAFLPAPAVVLGVLGGGVLGLLGSLASVGRHLRLVGRDRRRQWG
jgi:cell division transport system permease protein